MTETNAATPTSEISAQAQAAAVTVETSNRQEEAPTIPDISSAAPSPQDTQAAEQALTTQPSGTNDDAVSNVVPSATGASTQTTGHHKTPKPSAAASSASTETATATKSTVPSASSRSYASSYGNDDDTLLGS